MNTAEATEIVRNAIANTGRMLPEHWQRCVAQRAMLSNDAEGTGTARGSRYYATPNNLEKLLLQIEWEPYEHPAVSAGCRAFRAWLPGFLGIVPLARLPHNALLEFKLGKDETYTEPVLCEEGRVEPAAFTVIILGDEEPEVGEVVYTFHPGEPIPPFKHELFLKGEVVTAAQARALQVAWVKLP